MFFVNIFSEVFMEPFYMLWTFLVKFSTSVWNNSTCCAIQKWYQGRLSFVIVAFSSFIIRFKLRYLFCYQLCILKLYWLWLTNFFDFYCIPLDLATVGRGRGRPLQVDRRPNLIPYHWFCRWARPIYKIKIKYNQNGKVRDSIITWPYLLFILWPGTNRFQNKLKYLFICLIKWSQVEHKFW